MTAERPPSRRGGASRRRVLRYAGAGLAAGLAGCQVPWSGHRDPRSLGGERLRVGLLVPPHPAGSGMQRAARLAVEEVNSGDWWVGTEGVRGADLGLAVERRGALGTSDVRRRYRRLVEDQECVATVGAGRLEAVVRQVADAELLHLSTLSTNVRTAVLVSRSHSPFDDARGLPNDPAEQYEQFRYLFRPGPLNDADHAAALGEFVRSHAERLGWNRVAVLVENGVAESAVVGQRTFAETLSTRATEVAEVPVTMITSPSRTDWTPVYDVVESENCDAAVQVVESTGSSSVKQWADQERPFALGGLNASARHARFRKDTDGRCVGQFTLTAATPQGRNTEHTRRFVRRYAERFGGGDRRSEGGSDTRADRLSPAAFVTYDAVRVFAQAVHETGAHPRRETERLVDHLEGPFVHTHGTLTPALAFRGPDARYAHDPVWDCMTACSGGRDDSDPQGPAGWPVVQQWQRAPAGADGGRRAAIAPDGVASAGYRRPPWLR